MLVLSPPEVKLPGLTEVTQAQVADSAAIS